VAFRFEQLSVFLPRGGERLLGVVKQADVARPAGSVEQLVESGPAGDVALAAADAVLG